MAKPREALLRDAEMVTIKNGDALLENTRTDFDRKARKLAIDALNAALKAVDPRSIIYSKIKVKGNTMAIENLSFALDKFENIFVIGGGKASGVMAEALEDIVGDRIKEGLVNVPYSSPPCHTSKIKIHHASHPIPDSEGVEGTRQMVNLVSQREEKDLIICLLSGGGSSLMPLPASGISLEDKRKITDLLLKSGATIREFNTVRKHISGFKGGWLAKKAYPATVVNLILSDVVGDPLDSIASGPTVPDLTTFTEAIEILKIYGLWNRVPKTVRKVLLDGQKGLIPETPKPDDKVFAKVHNIVIGNNRTASLAAYGSFKKAGLNALLLSACLEGQARDVGTMFASISKEIAISGNPIPTPVGIIAGGETTVTVAGKGKGGRNQEIVLGAALKMSNDDGVVVASISTDGVDGPTDAAGAIADGKTTLHAKELELNPRQFLEENDSYTFFSKLGDLVFTGPTGTNVNDLSVIVVL